MRVSNRAVQTRVSHVEDIVSRVPRCAGGAWLAAPVAGPQSGRQSGEAINSKRMVRRRIGAHLCSHWLLTGRLLAPCDDRTCSHDSPVRFRP